MNTPSWTRLPTHQSVRAGPPGPVPQLQLCSSVPPSEPLTAGMLAATAVWLVPRALPDCGACARSKAGAQEEERGSKRQEPGRRAVSAVRHDAHHGESPLRRRIPVRAARGARAAGRCVDVACSSALCAIHLHCVPRPDRVDTAALAGDTTGLPLGRAAAAHIMALTLPVRAWTAGLFVNTWYEAPASSLFPTYCARRPLSYLHLLPIGSP